MSTYSLLCTTANTHGSLTLSSSLTFSSVGHVVYEMGETCEWIHYGSTWMIYHPTHHFFGYSTQWRPSCSCPSSQEGQGIYNYIHIMIYNYIYMFQGSSDPHMPFTCLASQHSQTCEMHIWLHIWEHANTGIRNAEACLVRPCVDICHIQWCIWIYVCKGHDWTHICLTYLWGWTCPTLLIQRSVTSVIPLADTVRAGHLT